MNDTLTFKKDQWVNVIQAGGSLREGQVVRTPSLKEVVLRDRNGDLFNAPLVNLRPLNKEERKAAEQRPIDSERERSARKKAEFRLWAISPLIQLGPARSRQAVNERAAEVNCDPVTLYRWLKAYEAGGDVRAVQQKRRVDARKPRLASEIEVLMESLIDRVYLQEERPAMSGVYNTLLSEIRQANLTRAVDQPMLPTPAFQTFRRRIYSVSEARRISRRYGPDAARALRPVLGHYPGADYPLSVVQIDHTPLDIGLVDSVSREYIGRRAWITLVMDVFSRAVLGFHISLDAPSAYSVGMAISHVILPKEGWLAQHKDTLKRLIRNLEPGEKPDLSWDCWGKPAKIKVDNAKEFWGDVLKRICTEYNMDLEFRPVHTPQYGAHIERLLGTLNREIHALPGTVFSNPGERGEYDSESRAVMTLAGLETWLTALILGVYHHRVHSEIGMTPMQRWEQGLLEGTPEHPPTGIPERIQGDRADRLRMDFLPYFEATVQRAGVRHNNLTYFGSVLRSHVLAKHPDHPTRARTFLFRYDPNDISEVYFLDPELDRYFEVRCRQTGFPSMSLWQLRAVNKFGKEKGVNVDDERSIIAAWGLMQQIVKAEKQETRNTRLENEKIRRREKNPKPRGAVGVPALSRTRAALNLFGDASEIEPFDDLES